ncbi:MAG: hypothetical protein Q9O62_04990 [Ardenticatenia bacterium]|nr:hypothetical protein [Ardenticatenia bacterium]
MNLGDGTPALLGIQKIPCLTLTVHFNVQLEERAPPDGALQRLSQHVPRVLSRPFERPEEERILFELLLAEVAMSAPPGVEPPEAIEGELQLGQVVDFL